MDSEPRSRESRAKAEEALVRFALLAGGHARDFVVIGGLNPDFLAPGAPHPHLGTTDIDLLFELGFVWDRDDLDFGWLDDVLGSGGFQTARRSAGWRWDGILGTTRVRLDLLCDVSDSPGQTIALPGAVEAAAQNLDGPAAALQDPIERPLQVPAPVRADFPDAPERVTLKFASLGGYLAAKSAALLGRGLPKDAYDLMFVILYAPGGPRAAAVAAASVRAPSDRTPVASTIRSAVGRFVDPEGPGVRDVVEQLGLAGDETEEEQLRIDVIVAARQFLSALGAGLLS